MSRVVGFNLKSPIGNRQLLNSQEDCAKRTCNLSWQDRSGRMTISGWGRFKLKLKQYPAYRNVVKLHDPYIPDGLKRSEIQIPIVPRGR